MSKLKEIVDFIALKLDKTEDYGFKETVAYSVKHWRAVLIRRDIERNALDTRLLQTICVPLEYGSTDLCCAVVTGCKGLVTTKEVPKSVHIKRPEPFYNVSTLGKDDIGYKSSHFWKESSYSKYTNKNLMYDVVNDRLYVKNTSTLKYVYITDIWHDPTEAFNLCNDNAVNPCDETEFPISNDMVNTIIEGIISLDLRLINQDNQEVQIQDNQ
jgi:hypothetical protein